MSIYGGTWSEARVDLLRKLVAEGLTFSQIGRRCTLLPPFNEVSRNAAIGKAGRLGLASKFRRLPKRQHRRYRKSPPRQRTTTTGAYPMTRAAKALAGLPREPIPSLADNDVARVSFPELKEHHCKWPVGDTTKAGTHTPIFCGAERVEGLPYCLEHLRRAHPGLHPPNVKVTEPSSAGAEARREKENA